MANRIADDFNNKLSEWELTGRVPYLVTDTEAKMNAAGQLLAENQIEHIYCLDHLLQLVAIMAYDADVNVDTDNPEEDQTAIPEGPVAALPLTHKNKAVSRGLLKSVRRLVGFFNKSTQAQAQLRKIQQERNNNPVNVVQDVVMRWWSTLAMLDRLFELRESLVLFADRHSFPSAKSNEVAIRMLTRDEWESLNLLRTVLRPFKVAQQMLEGNKYVTSSWVPYIVYKVQDELTKMTDETKNNNPSVRSLASSMLVKFNEIFGNSSLHPFQPSVARASRNRQVGLNKAFLFAHILDPRFKHGPPGASAENKKLLWEVLEDNGVKMAMSFHSAGE